MPLSDLPSKSVCGENAMPCYAKREGSWRRDILIPVADPDLQIRGGAVIQTLRLGGARPQKKCCRPSGPHFRLKIKGGRAPWALPLDPPLHTSLIGKVGTNVEVEPQLQPLDNERFQRFNLRSAVTSRRQDWT